LLFPSFPFSCLFFSPFSCLFQQQEKKLVATSFPPTTSTHRHRHDDLGSMRQACHLDVTPNI
jgi:hypothetical protein